MWAKVDSQTLKMLAKFIYRRCTGVKNRRTLCSK